MLLQKPNLKCTLWSKLLHYSHLYCHIAQYTWEYRHPIDVHWWSNNYCTCCNACWVMILVCSIPCPWLFWCYETGCCFSKRINATQARAWWYWSLIAFTNMHWERAFWEFIFSGQTRLITLLQWLLIAALLFFCCLPSYIFWIGASLRQPSALNEIDRDSLDWCHCRWRSTSAVAST